MDVENEILAFFGDATEEMVRVEYAGKSEPEILKSLNDMWPGEDNEILAEKISEWMS